MGKPGKPMNRSGSLSVLLIILATTFAGCNATRPGVVLSTSESDSSGRSNQNLAQRSGPLEIVQARLLAPADATTSSTPIETLSVDVLIAEVLARNPSLAQMTAAWQAAS